MQPRASKERRDAHLEVITIMIIPASQYDPKHNQNPHTDSTQALTTGLVKPLTQNPDHVIPKQDTSHAMGCTNPLSR